jgi:uncharacterized protein YcbK (DUF882 family)
MLVRTVEQAARSFGLGVATIAVLVACATAGVATDRAATPHPRVVRATRFFFSGSGRLVLRHAYFDARLDVRYRSADGRYDPAALEQIKHFFRSREDGREAPISLRLIELLGFVQDRYRPRQTILLSGFRSPAFNAELQATGRAAAQASLHTEAMAADVLFTGLDLGKLWRQLRELQVGGVGYYREDHFLHLDTGPPRFWEATTSRVAENLSAGNARLFVRTDFDRYDRLPGAMVSLHGVTAFPLRLAPRAVLRGPDTIRSVSLAAASQSVVADEDGCLAIAAPADGYQLRVADAGAEAGAGDHPSGRNARDRLLRLVVSTCEPRVERTPAEVSSNPIELRRP